MKIALTLNSGSMSKQHCRMIKLPSIFPSGLKPMIDKARTSAIVPTGKASPSSEVSGYFTSRWKGKTPLWKVFWIDYALGQLIAGACYLGLIFLVAHFSSLQFWPIQRTMSFYAALATPYLIFLSVVSASVWKCAPNTEYSLWCYISRIAVTVYFAWFLWQYLRFAYVLFFIIGQ